MALQSCVYGSIVNSTFTGIRTLTVVAKSQQISLYCFDGLRTSANHSTATNDARLLSTWFVGDCTVSDKRPIGVKCHRTSDLFSIFVTYTNTTGAYCRILSYRDDSLESISLDPSIVPFKEKFSCNQLQNVTAMVIMQRSRRVIFVMHDDSLMISATLDDAIEIDSAITSLVSSKFDTSKTLAVSDPSRDSYRSQLFALDCFKLPAFSTSNKLYRSLKSDDTFIQDIFAIEMGHKVEIVTLIQSKITGMKSFQWTQLSCLQADSVCHLDDKSHTDEKLFAQARLKVLYEVNLLSENAIVEVPYPAIADGDADICTEFRNGAIFVAVYETIQIFSENGLVKKVSVNSNICGLSILHVTRDLCTVLASTFPDDFLLCQIEMKKGKVSKNTGAILNSSKGHLSRGDLNDFSCIKLKLVVASGDPDQRPILPYCDNMVFIPRRKSKLTIADQPCIEDQCPILFLGYHRIYGCQLLQSVETVDSTFTVTPAGRSGAKQEAVGSGASHADLGPFECVSSGVLDRIAHCRIITPICDNPGKPYGTPDAFIAVCGDDLQGIRRRRKKRENEDRDKDKDRFTSSDSQAKPKTKSQGVNVTGRGAKEDAHQVEGEGETECTNILYRVHTGVTLVSEQEISLDLSEPDQDHDQGSEKDTSDAVTVTEQSKLFSFSFCPATPPPSSEGENVVEPAVAVAVLISSRAASSSSLVMLQKTDSEEKSAAFSPTIIEHEETLAWLLLPQTFSNTTSCLPGGDPSLTTAQYALQATSTSIAIVSLCSPGSSSQKHSIGEGPSAVEKFHLLLQKSQLYAVPALKTFLSFPNSWLIESLILETDFIFMTLTNRGKHFIAVARIIYTNIGSIPRVSLLDLAPSLPVSAMAVYIRPSLEEDGDSAKRRENNNRVIRGTPPEDIFLIISYWEKKEVDDEEDRLHHLFDILSVSEQQGSVSLTSAKGIRHGPHAAFCPQEESVIRHLFAFRGTRLSRSMGKSSLCILAVTGDGVVLTYWLDIPYDSAVEDTARRATLAGGGRDAGRQTDSPPCTLGPKHCEYVVLHSERFLCPCGSVRDVWTAPSSSHLESPLRFVLVGSGADYLIQPIAPQTVAHHYPMHRSTPEGSRGTNDTDNHVGISKSQDSNREGQNEVGGQIDSENGSPAVEDTHAEYSAVSWQFEKIARLPGVSTYLAPFTRPCIATHALRSSTPPGPSQTPPSGSLKGYLPCTAFVWIQRVPTRSNKTTGTGLEDIALPPTRPSDTPIQLELCVGYMRKGENPQIDACTYVRSVVRTVLVTPDGSKCIIFCQGNKISNQCSPRDGCLEVYDSTTLDRLWSSASNREMQSAVQSTISICPPFFPSLLSQFSILSGQHHSGSGDPRSVVTFGHLFAVQEGGASQDSCKAASSTSNPTPPSSSSAASAIAIWSISLPTSTTTRVVNCYSQRHPNPPPHPNPNQNHLSLMGCCMIRGEIDCFCPLDDKLVSFTLSGKICVSGWVAGDDDSEESTESKTTKQSSVNIQSGSNGARTVLRSDPLRLSALCDLQTDLEPFSVVEMISSRSDTIIVSLATGGICIYYLLSSETHPEDLDRSKSVGRPRGMGGKRDSLCRTYSLTRGHTFPLPHCLLTNIRLHQTPDSSVVRLFCADRMSQSLAIITLEIIAGTEYVKKQKKVEKLTLKLLSHGPTAVRGRGDADAGQCGSPNSYLKSCMDDLFDIVLDDRNSSSSFALLDRGCRVSNFSESQLAHVSSVVSSLPN